jgi:hypothetical protein
MNLPSPRDCAGFLLVCLINQGQLTLVVVVEQLLAGDERSALSSGVYDDGVVLVPELGSRWRSG